MKILQVKFTLVKGAKSEENYLGTAEDIQYTFSTVKPFKYKSYDTYNYYFLKTDKGESNPVYLEFSHPINEKSAKSNISVSLTVPKIEDYIEASNNYVKISNLPVTYNSKYTIFLNKDIEDIYGRKLGQDQKIEVEVPPAARDYNFPNQGTKMLEAKIPAENNF